ncbi:MAG: GNAT family N-acetyltransferase [Pseudomonadota bacterium]
MKDDITFARLSEIEPDEIAIHMSDPRLAEHMPLLTDNWDENAVAEFVAKKEQFWDRDGLGHWAILHKGRYVGWGGFQKENNEWDFGLVLKPDAFGLGRRITRKAIDFAVADERIPFVTFLLPPSRKNLGAFKRLGANYIGHVEFDETKFLKFRLETN